MHSQCMSLLFNQEPVRTGTVRVKFCSPRVAGSVCVSKHEIEGILLLSIKVHQQ